MTSLFIFRLDLRLRDNIGLIECFKNSKNVIVCFIFDPIQIDKSKNPYFSSNCVQFMVESLKELDNQTGNKLLFFHGDTIKVLEDTIKKLKIDNIYLNKDYTPFSLKRDKLINDLCEKLNCKCNLFDDLLLNDINFPMKSDNTPYQVYSKYRDIATEKKVSDPDNFLVKKNNISKIDTKLKYRIEKEKLDDFFEYNKDINVNGGRKLAKKILNNITEQKDYDKLRSLCDYKSTHLSAYIKFGCVSIREVYYCFVKGLGKENGLVKQLYWREFYYYLLYHFPDTLKKKKGLKNTYEKFPWSKDKKKFEAWCNGQTGFPIVDASMINLNKTGYMPNRSRLIVANFLTKLLRIDWTWGEKYFAQKLVDYSPSNNLGNWQWVASIGADYQNRIYNPTTQSQKSDPDCIYIKKWLPVLKDLPSKDIHNWNSKYDKHNVNYSKPIIVYRDEYNLSKKLFKDNL